MNASIDFWLDELDTQITELSAEQLRTLRAGVPPIPAGECRDSDAAAGASRVAATPAEEPSEWCSWSGLAAAGLA